MHWRFSRFVELEHLANHERKQLLRKHVGPRTIATIVGRSILLGMMVGFAVILCGHTIGLRDTLLLWMSLGAMLVGIVLAYQYHVIRIRGQLILHLQQAAREQRLPMCLRCGYDLEGLQSDTCPECGTPIEGTPRPGDRMSVSDTQS